MKIAVVSVALFGVLGVAALGCKSNKPAAEPVPTVTDVNPAMQPAPSNTTQTPAPVVVEKAPVETAPVAKDQAKGSITGKKYTVQTGDTLYSIAKRKYGSGSQANINKVLKANPGLKPETLKAGQTITLP